MAYYYAIQVESLERLTDEEMKLAEQYTIESFPRPVGKANVYFTDCETGTCGGVCTECKNVNDNKETNGI